MSAPDFSDIEQIEAASPDGDQRVAIVCMLGIIARELRTANIHSARSLENFVRTTEYNREREERWMSYDEERRSVDREAWARARVRWAEEDAAKAKIAEAVAGLRDAIDDVREPGRGK